MNINSDEDTNIPDTPSPADDGPEIVITARKNPNSPITFSTSNSSGYLTTPPPSGSGGSADGSGTGETTASVGVVNVQVDNPDNLALAIKAAENVAAAIAKILEAAANLPGDTVITWGNPPRQMTVATLVATIVNTEFVVTDRKFGNLGVGAVYTGSPINRDYLNFSSFVGTGGYADPNYTNGQGLTGIMLHEIGHLSDIGVSFTAASESAYSKLHDGSYEGYPGSSHWINNEKFVNDFMAAAAPRMSLDVSTFNPTYGYGSISPGLVR